MAVAARAFSECSRRFLAPSHYLTEGGRERSDTAVDPSSAPAAADETEHFFAICHDLREPKSRVEAALVFAEWKWRRSRNVNPNSGIRRARRAREEKAGGTGNTAPTDDDDDDTHMLWPSSLPPSTPSSFPKTCWSLLHNVARSTVSVTWLFSMIRLRFRRMTRRGTPLANFSCRLRPSDVFRFVSRGFGEEIQNRT